jgi:hypothetical protein
MNANLHTIIHRDGTVTYWSVYEQCWARHAHSVPDSELAAMSQREREHVKAALLTIDEDA